jgi:4a-hydroxytetrahydrobiopterin dehydratase
MALLSGDEVDRALAGELSGWQRVGDSLERSVEAESFPAGIDLVRRVAGAAEEADHHPDIDIRWRTLTFRLSTHSEGGLTAKDLELAATIDRLAATA